MIFPLYRALPPLDVTGQIKVTSRTEGSKNLILENVCERVIEKYSWENWKSAKYDPLLGLFFRFFENSDVIISVQN